MEIVENDQTLVENANGVSISEGGAISDAIMAPIIEEFELLEILDYD